MAPLKTTFMDSDKLDLTYGSIKVWHYLHSFLPQFSVKSFKNQFMKQQSIILYLRLEKRKSKRQRLVCRSLWNKCWVPSDAWPEPAGFTVLRPRGRLSAFCFVVCFCFVPLSLWVCFPLSLFLKQVCQNLQVEKYRNCEVTLSLNFPLAGTFQSKS